MGIEAQDYFAGENWHGKTVYIVNVHSGTAIDLAGGGSSNGTKLHGWEFTRGNTNQMWRVEKVEPGQVWSSWRFRNAAIPLYIDIEGGNTADGTQLHGWELPGGGIRNSNQEWFLIQHEKGSDCFMLQNLTSSTYADMNGGQSANGTKIQGWARNEGTPQLWRFVPV